MRLIKVDDHLKEELKDPHFKELYELEAQKFQVVKQIIAVRIKNGWTQADLAAKVGVTQQQISKIENGEFSSVFALEKVLSSLGLTIKIHIEKIRDKNLVRDVARGREEYGKGGFIPAARLKKKLKKR